MKPSGHNQPLKGSEHFHPQLHPVLGPTLESEYVTVTLILRRRPGGPKLRAEKDFAARVNAPHASVSREEFANDYGADPKELEQVAAFARARKLEVLDSHQARRSVVLRGTVAEINQAFGVKLQDYHSPLGRYHGHAGKARLPGTVAKVVEAVIGLDNRRVNARAYSTIRRQGPKDPPNTKPLTPQEIAQLYNFPSGDGSGQTIGIYEMATGDPGSGSLNYAGYTLQDVKNTMHGFGGNLKVPQLTDVSIDGTSNSGVNDGETLLDITVAGAIAQGAGIAVYFTGAETQNMIHALQRMIHPGHGDPVPNIISISYGWGPDDSEANFSNAEFTQFGSLFQDAANLDITVLISSGDSGAFIESKTGAQASYPATQPLVTACGGTTVGDVHPPRFDEYVWNDLGATGGGVSVRFPVPTYQAGVGVPKNIVTGKPGRGIPDIAGNASPSSGYMQNASNYHPNPQPIGGTSAVAPLYAGLFARINANLGYSVGFVNASLYSLPKSAFRDVSGPPGPPNNSFDGVTGYPAVPGWNACTGLGSIDGATLQKELQSARSTNKSTAARTPPKASHVARRK